MYLSPEGDVIPAWHEAEISISGPQYVAECQMTGPGVGGI